MKVFSRRLVFSSALVLLAGCVRVPPPAPLPPPLPSPPVAAVSPTPSPETVARFEAASGPCGQASDCAETGYGCGKLVCTSEPELYRDRITDCMVTRTPKDDGYACTCVSSEQRCGWVK